MWSRGSLDHVFQALLTSDVLVYSDTDNVVVISPQIAAHHELDDQGGEVSARFVVDAITAASVDVVSSATFRFSEVRTELNLGVSKSLGRYLPSVSYRFSIEPDYVSQGGTVGLQRRFAGGDTVVSGTYGLTRDTIGRVDTSFDSFSESLTVHFGEVGITQIIDPKTLFRLVYSSFAQFGYMEKPYRSVPLFDQLGIDRAKADGATIDLDTFNTYRLAMRPAEEFPDQRYRHAIGVRGIRYISGIGASARLDYRFYADSWGVTAHTFEPALVKPIGEQWRIDLWTRLHIQTAASFWKREYIVGSAGEIPTLRTLDRSLAESQHVTGGARVAWKYKAVSAYLETSAVVSRFVDFMFLDSRLALISQGGVRWDF